MTCTADQVTRLPAKGRDDRERADRAVPLEGKILDESLEPLIEDVRSAARTRWFPEECPHERSHETPLPTDNREAAGAGWAARNITGGERLDRTARPADGAAEAAVRRDRADHFTKPAVRHIEGQIAAELPPA